MGTRLLAELVLVFTITNEMMGVAKVTPFQVYKDKGYEKQKDNF